MKEATGELNSTVVVVMAVAMLMAFFYTVIWPILKGNMDANSKCGKAWCDKCASPDGVCSTVTCHYKDGDESKEIICPWKG